MDLPILPARRDCTLCPLYEETAQINPASVGIPSRWLEESLPPQPDTPVAVFIGQNPGVSEVETGQAFIGKSGEWLREIWIGGVDLQESAAIYVGNAARCGPRSATEMRPYNTCFPYMAEDLAAIFDFHHAAKRKAVILVSAKAVTAFFRHYTGEKATQKSTFAANGQTVQCGDHSVAVFSTYHPAAVMRQRSLGFAVDGHMGLVKKFFTGQMPTASKPERVSPRLPVT